MQVALSLVLFFMSLGLCGANHPQAPAAKTSEPLVFTCPLVESELSKLDQLVPTSIKVASITYEADIAFQPEEFMYLVGIKALQLITAKDLRTSLHFLAQKNKFSSIILLHKKSAQGLHLIYKLSSFWTFKKVTIKGLMTGREKYKQLYLVEPGEEFDEGKHQHSLENIKDEFKRFGHFNVTITDTFTYDEKYKEVYVVLHIKRGKAFKIHDVKIAFVNSTGEDAEQSTYSLSRDEYDQLMKSIDRKFSNFLSGHTYTLDNLNKRGKSLKKVLAQHGFLLATIALSEKIKVAERTVDLIVKIILGPKKQFVFFGNHFYTAQQLLEDVLAFGQPTLSVPASLLADEIQRLYHKKGFWQVTVQIKEEEDKIFFIIQEGQRAILEDVEIHGTHAIEERYLRFTYFNDLIKQKYIDNDLVQQQIDAVMIYYKNQGFWDVSLLNHTFVPRGERGHVLGLYLEEGPRYYLSAMKVPGHEELEMKGSLWKVNTSAAPLVFDVQYLADAKKYILDFFHAQGYLYLDVKPELIINVKKTTADKYISVVWHVTLHEQQVSFGKTVVSGVTPLPFRRLLRQLNYRQGDLWDKHKIDTSIANLRELELFEGIHLAPENIAEPSPIKPMILKLEEDDPFEIRLRGGVLGVSRNLTWREGATYKFGGSFLYKNPFKQGGQLRFDGDITIFERFISLYYSYPWLFGYPYKTTLKGYSNKYKQPVIMGSDKTLYVATQQGGVLSVNHKHKGWTLGINFGFEWLKTSLCSLAAARAIDFSPSLVDQYVPYVYIEPSMVIDYLDDKLNPRSGSFTVASLKGMFPFKHTTAFLKILIDQSLFVPVYRSLIFGFRLKVGHIFNRRFNQIMPPDRFFLGGAYSLRGYGPDYAPPLGCYEEEGCKRQYVPQGGKSMVNANFELRFPIYDRISGALFQDAGVLIGDHMAEAIKTRGVAATGGGIRYNTPIGPVRFDLGFKWKKLADSDSRVAWFLTLGNAF